MNMEFTEDMRICCGGCKITLGSSSFSSCMSLWTPDPSDIFRDNVEAFLDNDRFANSRFFRNKRVIINRMTGIIYNTNVEKFICILIYL